MTELSRTLLAAAREGLAPDAAVAARVRAKVAAAVGAASTTGAASVLAARKSSTSLLLKLGAALLALGVLATALVVARSERVPEVPRVSATEPESDEVAADVRIVSADDPVAATLPQAGQTKRDAIVVAARHLDAVANEEHGPVLATEPVPLSREVELIDLAMTSMRKHAPRVALEAIRVFERETLGQGQMAEEAAAIEIEARCELGEHVGAALARFDQQWPLSVQRQRLPSTCVAGK